MQSNWSKRLVEHCSKSGPVPDPVQPTPTSTVNLVGYVDDVPFHPKHVQWVKDQGETADQGITFTFCCLRKSRTTHATWGLALSCCNVVCCPWFWMKGKTCWKMLSLHQIPVRFRSLITKGVLPCAVMPPQTSMLPKPLNTGIVQRRRLWSVRNSAVRPWSAVAAVWMETWFISK